ncbi:unnamed protein product [Diatraea saccharalis]|uniref:Uncharacterized protein n=1 Tax=Diatraea saccharalis TaxID=40085 RepID=A0A9N9QUL3_9NEOP|nr:unnamed protein product [Diatraea saccharalis]
MSEEQAANQEEPKRNISNAVLASKSLGSVSKPQFGRSMSRLKVRRQSMGFSGVPGLRPVERTSQIGFEFKRPALVYLPTYQLEPAERFNVECVTNIVNEFVNENFSGHKYNSQDSPALALRLSGEVMRKIKSLCYDRYRIITVVTIGQKRAQSYNNAVAFLWDHERDNFVETKMETATAFIQIIVFGVYLD